MPELPLAVEPLAERSPLDERHHVEEEPVGVARVEQREDVRVLERRGGPDLEHEPVGAEHGGELGPQHLDRHLAVVLQVVGQIDRGHAALAELALEPVAVGEGGGEAGRDFAHRTTHAASFLSNA